MGLTNKQYMTSLFYHSRNDDRSIKTTSSLSDDEMEKVWKLRNETGVGVMECKKTLIRHDWDYEKAKNEVLHPKEFRI